MAGIGNFFLEEYKNKGSCLGNSIEVSFVLTVYKITHPLPLFFVREGKQSNIHNNNDDNDNDDDDHNNNNNNMYAVA